MAPPADERDSEARKARRRGELLDAALELFSEQDFYHVSIDEIASKAGVSKGTVYWYFESKESLLLGVIEREHGRIGERLESVARGDGRAIDKLRAITEIGGWITVERERLSRLVTAVLPRASDEIAQRIFERLRKNMAQYCELVARLMREASGTDEFKGFRYEELALLLGACVHGMMIRSRVSPEMCRPERVSGLIRELFIEPIGRMADDESPSEEHPS